MKVHARSCVSHKGLHQWWDDTHSKALNKYLLYVDGLNQEGGSVSRVNIGRLITSRHTSMFFKR